jgi:hypothetical protein
VPVRPSRTLIPVLSPTGAAMDVAKQIYGFAILHREKVPNRADGVGPDSIATFVPKGRSVSPTEVSSLKSWRYQQGARPHPMINIRAPDRSC